MNNYLCEYTCITRKRLLSLAEHGIIHLEKSNTGRKGEDYDRYGIRTSDHRRSSQEAEDFKIHCDQAYSRWKVGIHQNRKSLPSQPRSPRELHYQTDAVRRQKIKPACGWQLKIDFTAVRLPLSRSGKLARDNPWKPLLTFSITKVAQQCNGYTTMWAYERRCAHE